MSNSDNVFAGSIPNLYDDYLVPLIFQSYATDLVNRLRLRSPTRVLELAAGTGVVTRILAFELSESVSIVATVLNQAMLDQAIAIGTKRPVGWCQADAMELPFAAENEFALGQKLLRVRSRHIFSASKTDTVALRFHIIRSSLEFWG